MTEVMLSVAFVVVRDSETVSTPNTSSIKGLICGRGSWLC